ncbi:MAG: hypothetical protein WD469_15185 [Paenibacillaceae bacterium]
MEHEVHIVFGRDLAPRVAARMNAGQISDVIAIEKTVGEVCSIHGRF